jgi:hypothetical protein
MWAARPWQNRLVFRVLAVAVVGCGRIGFGPAADATISPIGCADGTREGLTDMTESPIVAACAATWTAPADLRAAPTGAACGNDLGSCVVPADACAFGWHVCTRSGDVSELQAIGPTACAMAGIGRFAAASSHSLTNQGSCVYPSTTPQGFDCSPLPHDGHEPLCCGNNCAVPGCKDGLWPQKTLIATSNATGCGALAPTDADGVLCCIDP